MSEEKNDRRFKRIAPWKRRGEFFVSVKDSDFELVYQNTTSMRIDDLAAVFADLRDRGVPVDEAVEKSVALRQTDWW